MNSNRLFFGLGITLGVVGCALRRPTQTTVQPPGPDEPPAAPADSSIPLGQLASIDIRKDGIHYSADYLARIGEPKDRFQRNDLATFFSLDDRESALLFNLIRSELARRTQTSRRHLHFADIPIGDTPYCLEPSCRQGISPLFLSDRDKTCLAARLYPEDKSLFEGSSWTEYNLSKIREWFRDIGLYHPLSLIAFSDCDDTLWSQGANYAVLRTAVEMGFIPIEKADELNARYNRGDHDQAYAYMTEEIYAGLTLNQVYAAFQKAKMSPFFPKVYSEMRELVNHLWGQGITVGYVSASPFFITAPMLEASGFTAPLWAIEGNDVFVVPPNAPSARPVKLSNLVQSGGARNWAQVLEKIGDYKIVAREMDQIVSREGKGAAARSILTRHVARFSQTQDRYPASFYLRTDTMRIAAVFGDDFAPFSDIPEANPQELGNDQGMLRAGSLMRNALLINIFEAEEKEGRVVASPKGQRKTLNFERLVLQINQTDPANTSVCQPVLRNEGRFVKPTSPIILNLIVD